MRLAARICLAFMALLILACSTPEKRQKDFFRALDRNEVALASKLLASHPELARSVRPGTGGTPLHYAKDVGLAESLLKSGLDLNATLENGRTPLHMRVSSDVEELKVLAFLLKKGAKPDLLDRERGYSPLHLAIDLGHFEAVKILVEGGADVDVGGQGINLTPLHLAVYLDRVDMARYLLEHGANRNSTLAGNAELITTQTTTRGTRVESQQTSKSLAGARPGALAHSAAMRGVLGGGR